MTATLANQITSATLMLRIARLTGDAVTIARHERILARLDAQRFQGVGTN